ncbi:MAG TPA: alpha/beta hydrolase [Rhizobacter sp.]|nr:alpha/beta hydrolase [Rhizobacter sp.]
MTRLFFAHANGFTPGAYECLLRPLRSRFEVEAPALKPLRTGRAPTGAWQEIASDLGELVDARPGPTIGVGHSLGAVALLMAASERPERFERLVLIDPPALPAWAALLLRHAPASVRRKGPMASAALRRVTHWPTLDAAFTQERARRWYARLSDEVLADVLHHGLQAADGGWQLRFRTEWEASLYETPESLWPLLRRPLPPITLLRGQSSAVFKASDASRWQALRPHDRVIEVADSGHLLPLEQPQQVLRALLA